MVETDCNKLVQTLIQKNKETKNNFKTGIKRTRDFMDRKISKFRSKIKFL